MRATSPNTASCMCTLQSPPRPAAISTNGMHASRTGGWETMPCRPSSLIAHSASSTATGPRQGSTSARPSGTCSGKSRRARAITRFWSRMSSSPRRIRPPVAVGMDRQA